MPALLTPGRKISLHLYQQNQNATKQYATSASQQCPLVFPMALIQDPADTPPRIPIGTKKVAMCICMRLSHPYSLPPTHPPLIPSSYPTPPPPTPLNSHHNHLLKFTYPHCPAYTHGRRSLPPPTLLPHGPRSAPVSEYNTNNPYSQSTSNAVVCCPFSCRAGICERGCALT
jgi:hypothetical protein